MKTTQLTAAIVGIIVAITTVAIIGIALIAPHAGIPGSAGVPGHIGTPGLNGLNGTNGINGHNGTNGTNGRNGTNGHNGTNGLNGTQGPQGQRGPQGMNGTNGTSQPEVHIVSITVVADNVSYNTSTTYNGTPYSTFWFSFNFDNVPAGQYTLHNWTVGFHVWFSQSSQDASVADFIVGCPSTTGTYHFSVYWWSV